MFLTTESGSRYEFDLAERRCRRLATGAGCTAKRMGDGEWRDYVGFSPMLLCYRVLIAWAEPCDPPPVAGAVPCTMTTGVASVEGTLAERLEALEGQS